MRVDGQQDAAESRRALALLLAGQLLAVGLLHALPAAAIDLRDPIGWFDDAGLEVALAAALRAGGLAVAWWLLLATLAALATAGRVEGSACRVVRRLIPRPLRTLADRAVVAGLMATAIVGPSTVGLTAGVAVAAEAPALVQRDGDGTLLPPGLLPPPAPEPAHPTAPIRDRTAPVPGLPTPTAPVPPPRTSTAVRPERAAQPPAPLGDRHVVESDEHLWSIAADHLATKLARPVGSLGDHEIAPYWSRLVAANTTRLRSGDPALIFPGEQLVMPPLDQRVERPGDQR